MDSNQKTFVENMLKGFNEGFDNFEKMKKSYEGALTADQRKEYDKQMKENNGEQVINDLKSKMEWLKNFPK